MSIEATFVVYGEGKGGHTPVEGPDTLFSNSIAHILDLVSEGEIQGLVGGAQGVYYNEVALQAPNSTYNFNGVVFHGNNGLEDQGAIPGFDDVRTSVAVTQSLLFGVYKTISFPNDGSVTAVDVTIDTTNFFEVTSDGDTVGSSVTFDIEKSENGGSFVLAASGTIQGKQKDSYDVDYRVPISNTSGQTAIRIKRTKQDATSQKINDLISFKQYTKVTEFKLTYPNSAIFGHTMDAKQFGNQLPTRQYHVQGIKVLVPQNYTASTRLYTGAFTGALVGPTYTNNPAWVFYDLITNKRYGLGQFFDSTLIDIPSLYNIAKWCDGNNARPGGTTNDYDPVTGMHGVPDGKGAFEPRWTCNTAITSRGAAFNVLKELVTCFRGILFWMESKLWAMADQPQSAVKIVTNANVINGTFTYSGESNNSRHSVVNVSWNDPDIFYRKAIEVHEDPALIQELGWKPTDYGAFGCTSRAQARRLGKAILYSQEYEGELVTYRAGYDHTAVDLVGPTGIAPGDIILIADVERGNAVAGGRLLSYSGVGPITVTLDRPITASTGTGNLYLEHSTGAVEYVACSYINGSAVVTLTASPVATPAPNDLFILIAGASVAETFRVVKIGEVERNVFEVAAVRYNAGKFAAIYGDTRYTQGDIMRVKSGASIDPPTNLIGSDSYVYGADQSLRTIEIKWTAPNDRFLDYYSVSYSKDNDNWLTMPPIGSTSVRVDNARAGNYRFRITSVNRLGVPTATPLTGTYVVGVVPSTSSLALGTIANLTLQQGGTSFSGRDASLKWTVTSPTQQYMSDQSVTVNTGSVDPKWRDCYVTVQQTPANGGATLRSESIIDTVYTYTYEKNFTDTGGAATRTFIVNVQYRDIYGRAAAATSVTVSNPTPVFPSNPIVTGVPQGVSVIQAPAIDTDYLGMKVYASLTAGFTPGPTNLVYAGPNTSLIINSLGTGTHYVVTLPYDTFGDGVTYTAQQSAVPTGAASVLLTDPMATVNYTIAGSMVTRTGGTTATWPNDVYSVENLIGSAYIAAQTSTVDTVFGLGPYLSSTTNAQNDLAYAIYRSSDTHWYIYENGTNVLDMGTAFTSTTLWSITCDAVNTRYYADGVLKRTIAAAANQTLKAGICIYTIGSYVSNIRYSNYTSNLWSAIGGAGKPQDNATVGADATNLTATIGGPNLLKNSSFEGVTYANGTIGAGFSTYTSDANVITPSIVAGRSINGHAQQISWTANTTSKGISLSNQGGVDNTNVWIPNKTMLLSFFAQATGAAVNRTMILGWTNAPTTVVAMYNPYLTSSWQRYVFKVTWGAVVDTSAYISIANAVGNGVSTIVFDDIQISEGDYISPYVTGILPQVGSNLFDLSGLIIGADFFIKNSAVSISSQGVLGGAGGGTVTLTGIAPNVDPYATRNRYTRAGIDPGYTEDGAVWGDSSGSMSRFRFRRAGAWDLAATDGAQIGANLLDQSAAAIATDTAIKNTAVSITPGGALQGGGGGVVTPAGLETTSGISIRNTLISITPGGALTNAGGGTVTLTGIAPNVDPFATRNRYTRSITDPGYTEDGASWGDTSGTMARYRVRRSGAWDVGATDGAQVGGNLLDQSNAPIATDAAIKNTAVALTAAGALTGAGGGAITALPADNLADGVTYGRYALIERTKLGGVATGATVGAQIGVNLLDQAAVQIAVDAAIKNSAVSLTAAGALSGAGGGAITALLADNLADGSIYGRYALVERTKLTGVQTGATVGARVGTNLLDFGGTSIATDAAIKNTAVVLTSGGVLQGAGGGTVTIGGLGYLGDLSATRNRTARQTTDPGYTEDGAQWFDNSGVMSLEKSRLGGVWYRTATDGSQVSVNLLDQSATAIAADSAIKNTAVAMTAAGALTGAGGGAITALLADNLADGTTYGRYALIERTKLGGVQTGATVGAQVGTNLLDFAGVSIATDAAIKNTAVAMTAAGALTGAGGGAITALLADNLADGTTYGRYALTERTKLTGVQAGATVGARVGSNLLDFAGVSIATDAAIKNTAVVLTSGGVLQGAGGGTVTIGGLGYSGDLAATRNRTARSITDPGYTEDGAQWFDNSGAMSLEKSRLGGIWYRTATDGSQVNINLLDQSATAITADSAIKNTAVAITAAGALTGAGGGAITALLADNLADGTTYGRYALVERTKLGGVQAGATVGAQIGINFLDFGGVSVATDAAIKNTAVSINATGTLSGAGGGGVTPAGLETSSGIPIRNVSIAMTAAGALTGAGGGAITALAADNLVDGTTYGRYALTERTKLTGVQTGATVGAQVGVNFLDFGGLSIATDAAIKNTAVAITAAGALTGAGGGAITALLADNLADGTTYGRYALVERTKLTGVQAGATVGAQVGINLKDVAGASIATDAAIKNTAIAMTAAGALTGAGGGAITALLADNLADGTTYGRYALTERTKLGGVQTGATVGAQVGVNFLDFGGLSVATDAAIKNTAIAITPAGALTGAGGGAITALLADNLADGITYGRYALVERTKLGGVATGATVGSVVGTNLLDQSSALIATDAAIKNTAVSITPAGALTGAGGGAITALLADNLADGTTYGRYALVERTKLGGVQTGATLGAQVGTNLRDFAGTTIATDAAIKNSAVSLSPAGALTGAGGGAITALLADNLADGTTYGRYALTERTKLGGVQTGATVGAQIGVNFLDFGGLSVATDAAIKNTAVAITAAGALTGAGGGAITALAADNLIDGTTYGRYALVERTKLVGIAPGATVGAVVGVNFLDQSSVLIATDAAIKNTAVSISPAGAITGGGGGAITALLADNLADGTTYGRYALVERTKLGGVQTGATVGARVGTNFLDFSGSSIATDAAIKNTAVVLTPAGVLQGAGGGTVTIGGLGYTGDLNATYGASAATFTGTIGGGNKVKNSGFEGLQNGTIGAGFALYNGDANAVVTSLVAGRTTGGNAQQLSWSLNTTSKGLTFANAGGIDNTAMFIASTSMVISFFARATGAAIGQTMQTIWATLPATTTAVLNPTLLAGWQRYVFRLAWGVTVDAAGSFGIANATANGVSTLVIDDIQIEEGDTATAYGANAVARIGSNLFDLSGAYIGSDAIIKNSAISINASGTLNNAGGGGVTLVGVGFTGDTDAQRNSRITISAGAISGIGTGTGTLVDNTTISLSPAGALTGAGGGAITALLADNLADGTTYGRYALVERTKLGGVQTGATVGARVGTNLLDFAGASIATDAAIKNTAVALTAAGALTGAGGGAITALLADNLADGTTYGRYALTERTKLGGVQTGATVGAQIGVNFLDFGGLSVATDAAIKNSAMSLSPAGALSGGGGGAITALLADNLADGTTYGRYALVERTKLTGVQAGATVGARVGTNLLDVAGTSIATDAAIKNTAIAMTAAGALTGAGGGAITALLADNLADGTTYGRYALTERTKLGGVAPGATVGAQIGANLLDFAGVSIATDAAVKNTAIAMTAAGALTGAGGGAITALLADNLADGTTYGRYALVERTKLGGVQTGATVGAQVGVNLLDQTAVAIALDAAIKNTAIAITPAGALTGAGGGAITALLADNLADGTTYGRYALAERTKLTGVQAGATVGARIGTNLLDFAGASIATDAAVKNTAVAITPAGVLTGAGGGAITALLADNLADGTTYGRYALVERTKLGGVQTGATVGAQIGVNFLDFGGVSVATDAAIKNTAIAITPAGALTGAGGGAITALLADNLADGTTYGRYALVERTKLGGVATGATVGAIAGTNLLDSALVPLTDKLIRNSYVENGIGYVSRPTGGSLGAQALNTTGAIKITLPHLLSDTNNTMLRFEVEIFEYNNNASAKYMVGGYTFNTTPAWTNTFASVIGGSATTRAVYFGNDGTSYCVWIGVPATVWQYPAVSIKNLQTSAGTNLTTAWEAGWTVAISTVARTTTDATIAQPVAGDSIVGVNLFDQSKTAIATDAAIKNSAVSISPQGVLGGAGGGTVTPVGLETSSGVPIRNVSIALTSAGALTGAGGGAITALPADNLADGVTYGRYALVERTKLGGVQTGATVGAQIGINFLDFAGVSVATDAAVKNTAIAITPAGALTGAGGGAITALLADNLADGTTYGRYALTERTKLGGVATGATVGAIVGTNLLDQASALIATDAAIKNSAMSLSPAGVLGGGGGGAITALLADNLADGTTYGRYALVERTKLTGVQAGATVGARIGTNLLDFAGASIATDAAVKNTAIALTPAGALTGAGGGAITALLADNLADGTTYGRYALTERTKLTGVQTGATVGAQIGVNFLDFSAVQIATDAVIKNSAVSINATGTLSGAGGGGVTPAGLETSSGVPIRNVSIALTAAGALTGAGGGTITALPADNLADGVTYGRYALVERTKLGGVATGATVGAQIGVNLLDQAAVQIATDAAIKNTAVALTPAGALTGAGGGAITALLADNLADGTTYGRYALVERTKLTGVQAGATVGARIGTNLLDFAGASIATDAAVKNTAVALTPAGALTGAGGGAITALLADNLADGTTYGRYALTERTKLTGVQTGATVGAQIGINLLDQAAVQIATDAAIKNTAVVLTSAGALTGAGGGTITALPADNLADGTTYGRYALTERTKLGGVAPGATVGAVAGTNLLDSSSAALQDRDVKNDYLEGGMAYIKRPGGGSYTNDNAAQVGSIRITLPYTSGGTMLRFCVDVFDYIGTYSGTYQIAGYSYGTGAWTQCSVTWTGSDVASRPVYFGYSGTAVGTAGGKPVIWIGDVTASWDYPKIQIRDFQAGYGEYAIASWATGWVISTTAIARTNVTAQVNRPVPGQLRLGSDILDSTAVVQTDTNLKNSAVSISPQGVLGGAGGGTVTLTGIAPGVDPFATSDDNMIANGSLKGSSAQWVLGGAGAFWQAGAVGDAAPGYFIFPAVAGATSAIANSNLLRPINGAATLFVSGHSWVAVGYTAAFVIAVDWYDSTSTIISSASTSIISANLAQWQPFSTKFTPPTNATQFVTYFYRAPGTGSVYGTNLRVAKTQAAATIGADITNLNVAIGGGNLVKNSSFEGITYTGGGGPMAAGFALYSNSEPATTSSIVAGRTGGNGLQVSWTANTSTKGFYFINAANVDNTLMFQANTIMMVSYYAKATGVAVGQQMQMAWNNAPSVTTPVSNPPLTANWQRYVFRLTWGAVTDGNGYVSIAAGTANGTATLVFDDVQVEVGDTVTAYGVNGVARIASNLYDLSNTLIATDAVIKNSSVALTPAGALTGAGGGTITALDFVNVAGTTRPANNATSDLTMQDAVGTNYGFQGNKVTRLSGTASWVNNAYSSQKTVGTAYISAVLDTVDAMIGLGPTNASTVNAYTTILYAVHRSGNGNWYYYESGAGVLFGSAYTAATVWTIAYDGVNIRYFADGVIQRTIAASANLLMQAVISIYTPGYSVSQIRFGPYVDNLWSNVGGTGKPANNADVTSLNTAANIANQGTLATLSAIDPRTAAFKALGAIPPSASDQYLSYSSSTTSVTLTWPAITLYRSDGTSISAIAGSQVVTGLTSGATCRAYPYIADNGTTSGTIAFATGLIGTPAILSGASGAALSYSLAYAQANIPLNPITVATTVSGTGGGGGSACVDVASIMPHGGKAGDVTVGSPLYLLREDDTGYFEWKVSALRYGQENCQRITTESGITLVVSESTPITTRDNVIVNVMDSVGVEVPVLDNGEFRWEKICSLEPMGSRAVALISANNGTYAAGELDNMRYIFTHNLTVKP